jgi:alkylation response protein AidB-like acyl-CoA dehydrogenase
MDWPALTEGLAEARRLCREAPMPLIGEGTADIQEMIIGRGLLEEYRIG